MRSETLPLPSSAPLDPRLRVLSWEPLNAETPLSAHTRFITPTGLHFVRSHAETPRIVGNRWRLFVSGEVEQPLYLSYAELRALPLRSRVVTLECAGNNRAFLHPRPPGEPWGHGAVSTADWAGVPLRVVLGLAGVTSLAKEVVFTGADVEPELSPPFSRSLPIEKAMDADTLLAFEMNGAPLPPRHGFPVRLIVPGWYGMASVKWLVRIDVIDHPFEGFYQSDRYVLELPTKNPPELRPLTTVLPQSCVVSPTDGALVHRGDLVVKGFAWSGAAPVTRVELKTGSDAGWKMARFTRPPELYSWRPWELVWHATPGIYSLECRAFDSRGNGQPVEASWNRLGYANNAIHSTRVTVR